MEIIYSYPSPPNSWRQKLMMVVVMMMMMIDGDRLLTISI